MILDGRKLSNIIINNVKKELKLYKKQIGLAIIWIGNDDSSKIYINEKIKKCTEVGIKATLYHLGEDIKEEEVLYLIDRLNKDPNINGIIIQLPIPIHIDAFKCCNRIDYKKDIDGLSSASLGNLFLQKETFVPCTAKGIIRLLEHYNIDLSGKNVCIINRSNILGKPLFHLLMKKNATVVVCHSETRNLEFYCQNADIIITATGNPNFLKKHMLKEGAIVIDAGINRMQGRVVGDADFNNIKDKTSYITPVPGGVGPMTIAMVLENVLISLNNK